MKKRLNPLLSVVLVLCLLMGTGIGQAVGELVGTSIAVRAADTLISSKYPFMEDIPVSPESELPTLPQSMIFASRSGTVREPSSKNSLSLR